MSQNNDFGNHASDGAQREHRDEENPRFGRGRRGNQEENGQNQEHNSERKNDDFKGPNRDSNKSESGPGKNNQNNQENSEASLDHPENENQDKMPNKDESRGERDNEPDGRGRDDRSEGGHWRDNNSDGRSERGEFDEYEEECESVEPEESQEECDDDQKPELSQQDNPNHGNHDFSDDGDHSDRGPGSNHHLPPGGPRHQTSSSSPGFMEKASAYTITFSNETMFEVLLGSMLLVVSAVVLFIYMVKRQRRKTIRSQSPVQFVAPNQNIATANFYQYYQKQGLIPTGTVVGYIPEGQFLQPDAKNSANLKSFGRLPTQDEILDLS